MPSSCRRDLKALRPESLPSVRRFAPQPTSDGPHDLVGLAVLEHAVLVDARLVREGVGADHGLVGLHRVAGDGRDQLARRARSAWRRCRVVQGKRSARVFTAITISSSEALPARSPRPLMVHSTCRAPVHHRGERVGHRHAEVVVAVRRPDRLVGVGDAVEQGLEELAPVLGHAVAHGVGHVDGRRARLDARPRRCGRGSRRRSAPRPRRRTRRRR